MAYKRISIQLSGDPSDEGYLLLNDFIAQFEAIRSALTTMEDHLKKKGDAKIQYRIVDISHNSPMLAVLEAVPQSKGNDISSQVVDGFMDRIEQLNNGTIPKDFDYGMVQAFKKVGSPLKKHVSNVIMLSDYKKVELPKSYESQIEEMVGKDEIMLGTVSGVLEVLNIHAGANIFRIYPIIGPKKVECHFKNDALDKAIAGINRYVKVSGEKRYKKIDKHPYAVNVRDIEIYPDEQTLPSIFDLRGIAPNATGNISSEDFVRGIRDGQW